MSLVVTTSEQAGAAERARAARVARLLSAPLRSRREVDWTGPVLVVGRRRLFVRIDGRELGWHPGMVHTRLEAGPRHPMARAMRPRAGELVLDGTLGFGTDAAFLARAFGVRVVGVEASPLVALLAGEGLRASGDPIRVVCAESGALLDAVPAGAVDVVYGDPLFEHVTGAHGTLALPRRFGSRRGVDAAWLLAARRAARRVVVVKDDVDGDLLERLGAERIEVGRGRTRYGAWRSLEGHHGDP